MISVGLAYVVGTASRTSNGAAAEARSGRITERSWTANLREMRRNPKPCLYPLDYDDV